MKTILVPTDFSVNSITALDYAASLAVKTGARLVIMHSVSLPPKSSSMIQTSSLRQRMMDNAQRDLDQMRKDLLQRLAEKGESLSDVHTDCETFSVVDHVVSAAEDYTADLIVMGTQGATNLENVLLGSTTAKVIKKAVIPVLAVPRDFSFCEIKKIALATDSPDVDSSVFSELVGIAQLLDAAIKMVHISKEADPLVKEQMTERRKWVESELGFTDLSCQQVTAMDPLDGLLGFIEEEGIDMIAMQTHNRGFFENLLHTSLTKKMAMTTRIPLLAFHD